MTLSPHQLVTLSIGSAKQDLSFYEATARVNIWEGSVSSGKTFVSALRWAAFVVHEAPPGRLLMIGQTKHTLYGNVLSLLMDRDLVGPIADEVRYTPGADRGRIGRREIEVIGANNARAERRIRGASAAGAYVDEITLLPDHAYWLQLMNRLRVEGARAFGTTNPDNPTHWCKADVIDKADELGYRTWHFTMADNPGLPPGYVDQVSKENTGLWYQRNILGLWVLAEGRIWDMWDETRHLVTDEDLADVEMIEYLVAGDYGTAGVTVFGLLGLGSDDRVYLLAEWRWDAKARRQQLTDVDVSRHLRGWLTGLEDRYPGCEDPWRVEVDPSASSLITQMRADGWTVQLASNNVLDGIRNVGSLLAVDRLKVHESCTGLRGEVPGYVWDPKAAEKEGRDAPVKANDHSCDMVRYGVAGCWSWWRDWVSVSTAAEERAED